MNKRILITGISGQLGSNIAYLMYQHYRKCPVELLGIYNTRHVLSNYIKIFNSNVLTNEKYKKISNSEPDLIIHCAALANIDICELQPKLAYNSNVYFTKNICNLFPNSKIIYISTDNVHWGGNHIYKETDATIPKNNYGRTKLLGEEIVRANCEDHLIFRTNIYGWDNRLESNSFLERIYRNFAKGFENKLFYDVIYCPISINLLFEVLLECIEIDIRGTFNIVGPSLTKLEFGKLVSEVFGFDCRKIKAISIDEMNLPAQRPKVLNLSNEKIFNIYPKVVMSTFDQISNMKYIIKSGYKEKLANFINLGE